MSQREIIIKFAKDNLWYNQYSPWKWYKKGVSFGFGVTFIANTATGLIGVSSISPYDVPGMFFGGVFLKSGGYGIVFPSIPIKLLTAPSEYLVLN